MLEGLGTDKFPWFDSAIPPPRVRLWRGWSVSSRESGSKRTPGQREHEKTVEVGQSKGLCATQVLRAFNAICLAATASPVCVSTPKEGEADPARPSVRFEETSKQLVAQTRAPPPPRPGKPERCERERERQGAANVFMLAAPRLGWRRVNVTARRARANFAEQMRPLADDRFPRATTIRVVLDNLNTHHPAGPREAFAPEEAKRILIQVPSSRKRR